MDQDMQTEILVKKEIWRARNSILEFRYFVLSH